MQTSMPSSVSSAGDSFVRAFTVAILVIIRTIRETNQYGGNLVVLCGLVGGQNGSKRTMLSCQTLGRSGPFDRILKGSDLKYPNKYKFALLIVV